MTTDHYNRVGRHDVSQRRMVTVHDVINNRNLEGKDSLGQRFAVINQILKLT